MNEIKESLISDMKTARKVCVTADHWTSFRKGYIGVTGHWYNSDNERVHACLALRRVRGSVTYDVIAELLQDIFHEYGIAAKISHCITDAGSNFVKAFKVYTDAGTESTDQEEDTENDTEAQLNPGNIEGILNQVDDDSHISLPRHMKCAAHRLNLVGAQDAEKGLLNPVCKRIYRSVMAKLQQIWNKQNMSTLTADKIRDSLGCLFITPNDTRWNSRYDATEKVISLLDSKETEIAALCLYLNIRAITEDERQFLNEFVKVMRPLAMGLDVIQGQHYACAGYLLPTIRYMLDEWNRMTDLRFTNGLVGK